MIRDLLRRDAYLRDCSARVVAIDDTCKGKDADGRFSGTICHLQAPVAAGAAAKVQPPRGTARVRTIRIGDAIDYQPWGGTHVANTSEVGAVVVTRIEEKSASTRRVVLDSAPAGT